MTLREFVRWAWNPPAGRMITDHAFVPVSWMPGCGAIPGHPDGYCPTGRCQHNTCSQPRRYHQAPTQDSSDREA